MTFYVNNYFEIFCAKKGSAEALPFSMLFLRGTDHAHRGSAVGALALRNGLAVLRNALDRVEHNLFGLALNAVTLFCHGVAFLFVRPTGRSDEMPQTQCCDYLRTIIR